MAVLVIEIAEKCWIDEACEKKEMNNWWGKELLTFGKSEIPSIQKTICGKPAP